MRNGFRFSRDKWFGWFTFPGFFETAQALTQLVKSARPTATVEVITCEDFETYRYANISFDCDEVNAALEKRKHYSLENFTKDVWKRSKDVQLTLKDPADPNPFMVTLSCDRYCDSGRLMFYGQEVDPKTCEEARALFGRANLGHDIGNGFPKRSNFNFEFGRRLLSR